MKPSERTRDSRGRFVKEEGTACPTPAEAAAEMTPDAGTAALRRYGEESAFRLRAIADDPDTPVKLKADGCVLRFADRHFAMTDGQEDYTCSGEALRSGIPLAMQYSGTGYSPDLRILGDWGSSLYVAEEIE